MSRAAVLLLACAIALGVAGCSTPPLMVEPIGPVSGGRVGFAAAKEGMLIVYTRRIEPYQAGGGYGRHTAYWIADPTGRDIRWVHNCADDFDPRPEAILLLPGDYLVKAKSESAGAVRVPIQILSGKLTIVRLDAFPNSDFVEVPTNDLVRLPDGRVAGRRAAPEIAPAKP